jgi:guanine deaminase
VIVSGQLLLAEESGCCRLAPGWLCIEGRHIVAVHCGETRPDCDFGSPDALIAPGFVDVHLHLPQIDAFGRHGRPLIEWLETAVFPAESAWADPAHAAERAASALSQLWASGTTGIFAFTSNHRHGARSALRLCRQAHMRALIGQALSDIHVPASLLRSTDDCINDAIALLEEFPPGGTAAAAVAPRFALSATPELLAGCGRLAAQASAHIATHLAENLEECERATTMHAAADYTSIYARHGLLGARAVHGHCIHLSPAERRSLAASRTVVAHCPTANDFLCSGTMNRALYLREGLGVALGSDIGAGYEKSMVRVARAMLASGRLVNEAPASAAEAWWQITAGNAGALGWEDCGRLAPGMRADLLVIEPTHAWLHNPAPLDDLLWTWDDRWLASTLLAGSPVFQRPV